MNEQPSIVNNHYVDLLQNILIAVLILVVGWVLSKWVNRIVLMALRNRKVDEALSRFLSGLSQYATLALAIISALGTVGIETTSLVAVLASAGIAIGLALQGSLSNFASGVMILFFRPFDLKDFITAAGESGVVEDIGIFTTVLLTPQKHRIIIPNGAVLGGPITNYTAEGIRRGTIEVGVAYGVEMEAVIEVLDKAADRCDLVLEDPKPIIAFTNFGASSLDFAIHAHSKTPDYHAMLHQVRVAVYDDLNAAGIEIPFAQIVVHQAEAGEAAA
ncbi:mechanosensitive ion channel family protein [Acanthopleuribacter pedis]|uniref:Mechanosensitive ion channel n=1 Tax=Acanthopleuribacter pedis TaxID=442870 RepID=A0A8J7QAV5_9BACT|nr:mechanosensitive ion channel domain-containing protein [Acanthopleuribacter pedis]MBO1321057.1 mechanosensitive ion channel [Acanthopleuribacter pedis]